MGQDKNSDTLNQCDCSGSTFRGSGFKVRRGYEENSKAINLEL